MDALRALKRRRTQNRREFTIAADELRQDISAKKEISVIDVSFANLAETADALFATEEMIRDKFLEVSDLDENEYQMDQDIFSKYRKVWVELKTTYNKLVKVDNESKSSSNTNSTKRSAIRQAEEHERRRFKLPTLELAKFDGNIKLWITFWGQFRKIHDDDTLADDDKFQYLLQSMTPNSSARQLVESYPPYGENYQKAVEALRARFARDDLLIQSYVRDLQNLVLLQGKGQQHDLRTLYDKLQTHLQALETLGVTKDKYAAMLLPMVESALSEEILRTWNRSRTIIDKTSDELTSLLLFLKREVESEERIEMARTGFQDMATAVPPAPPTMGCFTASSATKRGRPKVPKEGKTCCLWCDKETHSSSECYKAAKMTLEEKKEHVRQKKGCEICLRSNHHTKKCRSYPKCLVCKERHVTLMCPKLPEDGHTDLTKEILLCKKGLTTLLPTFLVQVFEGDKYVTVRALIDSGAQRSFLVKSVVDKLKLKATGKEEMSHSLFGGVETKTLVQSVYTVNVRSLDAKFVTKMSVLEQDNICSALPRVSDHNLVNMLRLRGIVLTDATDDCTRDISLLIGADYSGQIQTGNIIQLDNKLTLTQTRLGWTVQGPTTTDFNKTTTLFCASKIDVTDLWNLETLGIKDPAEQSLKATYDNNVLQSFQKSITTDNEGRYEVRLPWRDMPRPQTNFELAKKRLDSTYKRLQSLGKVEQYDAVFKEWFDLNIIESAPNPDISGHYLPHHAVIKEESLTTKLRPVFDASAKDKHGISLNSCLEKGANLIEFIPDLLIDFRKGAIGVTADVAKAFLQISLYPEDREYLKFLWWAGEAEGGRSLITYRHKRVVFGVTSSPFHLAATIGFHLDNSAQALQQTATKLKKSFYVDNCVTSVDSEDELNRFVKESKELMANGKFDLRQWVTAPVRLDAAITTISVLGILWNTENDFLYCNTNSLKVDKGVYTKRSLLSATQTIFDPIGITCPTTIILKQILQKVWSLKLLWDDELPCDIVTEFKKWLKGIHLVSACKVPRRLTRLPMADCELQIHVFCDASKYAYSACVFLRSKFGENVDVRLILAKARVTPVKGNITIPRLELIACLMSTRLCKQVREVLSLKNFETYYWTDSSVALSWIKGDGDWTVFVANRVREIREHSAREEWHHVPGQHNPADLPSRGCNAKKLLKSCWWEGPSWLLKEREYWPFTQFTADVNEVNTERKRSAVNTILEQNVHFVDSLHYFSSFTKILRMICWILRWRKKPNPLIDKLSYDEIECAEIALVRLIQDKHFSSPSFKTKLLTFYDDRGVLRLNTKLELGNDNPDFKFPIVLPGNEPLVQRLVEERHKERHVGAQSLMVMLRERYWIIGLRRLVKRTINDCIKCKRYKVKPCETLPIGLPIDRVKNGKAFEVTGVDLAGPLLLRGQQKCWIVLFTCAIYRAVHLELVNSLSTDAFMMALRRFIARRGRVNIIYSDNGTNFVGMKNLMDVAERASAYKIKWRFSPPGAPWWGGWWERLIGVVKQLLRRILGKSSVDFIELETVLCDCEATVNSRPLTYVSGDDEYLIPLTPSTFIQPMPCVDVTDFDSIDAKSLNVRHRYMQKLRDDFRQRFRNEYLSMLVQFKQNKHSSVNVGDIVLMETQEKRMYWPLGVIVEILPGADGLVRVARVKTDSSTFLRPLQKLYPLELSLTNDNHDSIVNSDLTNTDAGDIAEPRVTRSGRVVRVPQRFLY